MFDNFWKKKAILKKKSADNNKTMKNYPKYKEFVGCFQSVFSLPDGRFSCEATDT